MEIKPDVHTNQGENLLRRIAGKPYRGAATALRRRAASSLGQLRSPLYAEPGHYLSPIAGAKDVEQALRDQPPLAGLDLCREQQVALIQQLAECWHGLPDDPMPGWRYRSSAMFAPADATVYVAMLKHFRPQREIEVGSGFTSALALDTRDRFLPELKLTFIEPYPDRLHSLLREHDRDSCEIIPLAIQDVPLETFDALSSGDILFVDTSHVAKTGSDVNWIIFNVFPRLAHGVIVHIHDIFWPFEYPRQWVEDGRSWSEIYLLRAFLMYNSAFSILLFNDWMWHHHPELLTALDPAFAGATGSIWLRVNRD
jgi:hypothetical protein